MTKDAREGSVRVRVAPSPTGDPHVGTAYIALFNRVFAKKEGGTFILRIEDTDRSRSRRDSEHAILEALKWAGLTWDEGPDIGGPYGPYRQSERQPMYAEHTAYLLTNGGAYRCFCTPERLEELREKQRAAKETSRYDGHCRALSARDSEARAKAGEPFVVRLAVPRDKPIVFTDRLRGKVEISPDQVDDQVLLKTDGFPTYHLASVVDDHLMKISHVIRAEEWISSTPKHVLLYRAFGWQEPEWIHMPLLRNADKSKISKRKNPVSINYYKDIGILPEALVNFLANMGWSFGGDREKFTVEEMIQVFSWDKVSLGGPVFDLTKLEWMNEQYIHDLSDAQLADRLAAWRLNRGYFEKLAALMKKRIKKLGDFIPGTSFFFEELLDYRAVDKSDLAVPEQKPADVKKKLLEFVERIDQMDDYSGANLEKLARAFCDETGWKTKHLFMLLRLGVTGRKASPGLFETMEALGKELTRARIRNFADHVARA
jgi:glutamyl-tRNA synthetase